MRAGHTCLGNLRDSAVWHTEQAEDGTSARNQRLRCNSWRRTGQVGLPLSTSCPGYCLGKADQREDSTELLRDTKLLNSGKRSCAHQDTREAWVLSRAHSTSRSSLVRLHCGVGPGPAPTLVKKHRCSHPSLAPWRKPWRRSKKLLSPTAARGRHHKAQW